MEPFGFASARLSSCFFVFVNVHNVHKSTCNTFRQSLPWNEVLAALPDVSSKYSKFVSVISSSRFRTRMSDGTHMTIRNLRSANYEFDLLLLLSRAVVMSAADEIYNYMPKPSQCASAGSRAPNLLHFFCAFLSCIRGYKRLTDSMIFFRQQVLMRALRRLQGGLMISKVYVNCLVSRCFLL
jgi:hypothetical protein